MSSGNISSSSISILTLIQNKISLGFGLIFLIFGVTGCFLNILLFSRRQFREVSCCTYFLGASVAMSMQLIISSGPILYSAYHPNSMYFTSTYCKIWYYLVHSTSIMFRWMLAAACLDRYALSSANPRLRRFASVHLARRVVAALVLIWIVLPVPLLVLYDVRTGNCIIIYGYTATLYYAICSIINIYGIPISVMITCALLIRRNMTHKRERRQQLNGGQQQRTNDREHLQRKRDQQALVMLFAQIIVYIILTTPWVMFSIYNAISLGVPNKSADRLAIERFLLLLAGNVILLFPTASFYLYTLTSGMFRKELLIMLRSVACCKYFINNRRIEPKTETALQRTLTLQ